MTDGSWTRRDAPPPTYWLLEGGEDPWEALVQAVSRRLDESGDGGALELVSWHPETHGKLAAWCLDTGHELTRVAADGASTRFWITRRGRGKVEPQPWEDE
jgi:TusA-related sulfurtransferase